MFHKLCFVARMIKHCTCQLWSRGYSGQLLENFLDFSAKNSLTDIQIIITCSTMGDRSRAVIWYPVVDWTADKQTVYHDGQPLVGWATRGFKRATQWRVGLYGERKPMGFHVFRRIIRFGFSLDCETRPKIQTFQIWNEATRNFAIDERPVAKDSLTANEKYVRSNANSVFSGKAHYWTLTMWNLYRLGIIFSFWRAFIL